MCYTRTGGLTAATFITPLLVPGIYAIFVLDLRIVRWEGASLAAAGREARARGWVPKAPKVVAEPGIWIARFVLHIMAGRLSTNLRSWPTGVVHMRDRKSGFGWWPVLNATGAALVLLFCVRGAHAQQPFGYVLDIRGDWLLNGNVRLYKGSSVSVGGEIRAANPGDGGNYIVITDRGGRIHEQRSCGNGGCNNPIRLPNSAGSSQSFISRVIGVVAGVIEGQPAKYAVFIHRGAGLEEAVLKLDAQKLDLSRVFKNMPGDRYFVRFERLGKGQKAEAKPVEVEYEWDSQKPAPLEARGIGPGLYRVSVREVSLLASEDEGEASGNDAWVLVTTSRGYAKAAPSFDEVLKVTRQWGDQVRQSSVRQFLRAALEYITTQSQQ